MEKNCKKKIQGGVITLRYLQGTAESREASKSNADLESGSGSRGRTVSAGKGRALENKSGESILETCQLLIVSSQRLGLAKILVR